MLVEDDKTLVYNDGDEDTVARKLVGEVVYGVPMIADVTSTQRSTPPTAMPADYDHEGDLLQTVTSADKGGCRLHLWRRSRAREGSADGRRYWRWVLLDAWWKAVLKVLSDPWRKAVKRAEDTSPDAILDLIAKPNQMQSSI
ncbi:hypothetical protein L2E82_35633 [Cichorium intybus]|uniref:Uncharacterized protein n=1 Tax=Cichorium intybus TaxID=13427 RepID=A0ACB9BPB0_CICIN|nr:hypothetical protein L2E82_35633 [Cichorium intybus]